MDFIQDIVKSILSFSSDVVIIVALTAIFASIGLFFGKSRLVAIILAFYPVSLILSTFPYLKSVPQTIFSEIVIFLVFYFITFYLFSFILSTQFSYQKIKRFLEAVLLGLTATALTIVTAYHTIDLTSIYNFSGSIDRLFLGDMYFWWLIIPLGILFIFKR